MGRPPTHFEIDGEQYTSAMVAQIRGTTIECARVLCWKYREGKITADQLLGPAQKRNARMIPGQPTAEWKALQDKHERPLTCPGPGKWERTRADRMRYNVIETRGRKPEQEPGPAYYQGQFRIAL